MRTRALIFVAAIFIAVGLSASVATADGCACGGGWHYADSCQPAPVLPPGMNPATQWCWNPVNGWHYHLWF